MSKENGLAISIFCLAISIIIGANIIGSGMKKNGEYINGGLSNTVQGMNNIGGSIYNLSADNGGTTKTHTLDFNQAAVYLGVDEGQLTELVNSKHSRIPYILVSNKHIFSKEALNKWLENAGFGVK